jgi:SAM-dependent methyltransferase
MGKRTKAPAAVAAAPLMLDLGCGPTPRAGFVGLDRIAFPGTYACDLSARRWVIADPSALGAGRYRHVDEFPELKASGLADGYVLADGCVEEAHSSHFLEHLTAVERVRWVNELYRVLKPGGKCTLIVPHWASCRAYGDPTHQWPPVSEFWFHYLDRPWREGQAPHSDARHWPDGFACDFFAQWGYGVNPAIASRAPDFQNFALLWYKEAITDIHATLVKK